MCTACSWDRVLRELAEVHAQIEPLRLQIEALTKTRDRQIKWSSDAQRCLIELARLLREFTSDTNVSAAVKDLSIVRPGQDRPIGRPLETEPTTSRCPTGKGVESATASNACANAQELSSC
jgi:hypothetical protein